MSMIYIAGNSKTCDKNYNFPAYYSTKMKCFVYEMRKP